MNKQFLTVAIISVFCQFNLISARTSDELRITLPDESKLVGRTLRSYSGRSIKAWLGIPYAKAPIGHLRFKVIFVYRKNFYFAFILTMIMIQQNKIKLSVVHKNRHNKTFELYSGFTSLCFTRLSKHSLNVN